MTTLVDCPKCGKRQVTTNRTAPEGPVYVCADCGVLPDPDRSAERKKTFQRAAGNRCLFTEELFDGVERK